MNDLRYLKNCNRSDSIWANASLIYWKYIYENIPRYRKSALTFPKISPYFSGKISPAFKKFSPELKNQPELNKSALTVSRPFLDRFSTVTRPLLDRYSTSTITRPLLDRYSTVTRHPPRRPLQKYRQRVQAWIPNLGGVGYGGSPETPS